MKDAKDPRPVVVLRCGSCGDTFPTESPDATCPTCGSIDVHPASEPML